ncbi:alkaline phosphatase family protein [Zavarzinia sp. CC-PAN008]|uniref:alkaline phosphatase family protein n=1 Tax=Zavarzinia sp. CC-PAN008 TaxID=3243332 RepID=UPI003F744988
MPPPLNVLLITADQWRGDCLSALGHPMVRTPNLDALARDGVLFRRHYAQAVPCGPSRACLLTGMYLQNHRSGTNGTPLDARHTNLALEVRRLGYEPALFGYTDTSADPRALDEGDVRLRTYEGIMDGFVPVAHLPGAPTNWVKALVRRGYAMPEDAEAMYAQVTDCPEAAGKGPSFAPAIYAAADSDTAFLTDEVIDYWRSQQGRPWVAHLSWLRPHPPWVAPAPYHAMYEAGDVPPFVAQDDYVAEGAQHPWLAWQLDRLPFRAPPSELVRRQFKATYYGLISEVDDNLGRLVAWLKQSGEYERTLIVFTTDHGEQLGDHWLLGKCGYFEQSYHIPLIIRDPRAAADAGRGRVVDRFTESVDLMPTILRWLGAVPPRQCDGRSLLPFLEGTEPQRWRDHAHWEFDFRDPRRGLPERAFGIGLDECNLNVIRGVRYKYVHFAGLPPLFFDLEEDPGELRNRVDDPRYAAEVLACAQALLSWRMANDERTLSHHHLGRNGAFVRPLA